MPKQLIGFRIRERRKRLGLTQVALARTVGVSASYLNLIEANKRDIAGGLLGRIATELGLGIDALSGTAERRLVDELREMSADPLFGGEGLSDEAARDLVSRHVSWAETTLALYRAYVDRSAAVTALSERLSRDPFLGAAVHQVLTRVTTIRSAAEILEQPDDLQAAQRDRFVQMIAQESARLTDAALALADFFESSTTQTRSLTPAVEVDDFLIEVGNHFPAIEAAAEGLRREIELQGETLMSALMDHLERRHGIGVANRSTLDGGEDDAGFRNHCRFDASRRMLVFLDNASVSTRRFQLARLAAELDLEEVIATEVDHPRLTSDGARTQASRALASYAASVITLPYEPFLEAAEQCRYDIEVLRHRFTASFEQVAHRLTTLARPGAEGVPFAFLRANPAGHTTKRFPLPRLPMPRHGHACSLWAVYQAFQTPGRVVRQLAEFPDRGRFLLVARTVTKQPATFHDAEVLHSVMIACDAVNADRTVYGDGLDLAARETASLVGQSCRVCPRASCLHREEEQIVQERSPAAA